MKFIYTDHLKSRLKSRGIPLKLAKEIFNKREDDYWDNLREHAIKVGKVVYKEKLR